eukprot:TRINITY_DN6127_c0_g3_i1.p1 TRINITY_DN6127_c0_g3~~TRINITY_DN6127_c0_g3_i1.p1  ORF type:complete len:1051 (+),score=335.68 TRINITY_DN6127_c0_g3_i1:78-3155(+)
MATVGVPTDFSAEASRAAVLQCLITLCHSVELPKRQQAEAFVTRCFDVKGFAPLLTDLFLAAGAVPNEVRHLAALVLKKLAAERWDGGEQGECEDLAADDKQYVRQKLPQGFFAEDSKLATAAGLIVGVIAQRDFPDEWPSLVQDLAALIAPEQPPSVVAAAVKCVCVVLEDFGDDTLDQVCATVLPRLCALLQNPAASPGLRRLAIKALDLLTQTATQHTMKASELPGPLRQALPPLASGCLSLLGAAAVQQPALGQAALSLINIVLYAYPAAIASQLQATAGAICASLVHLSGHEDDVDDGYCSDDGDAVGHVTLCLQHLEVMETFLKKQRTRNAFAAAAELNTAQGLRRTADVLRRASWLSPDDIAEFEGDCSRYIDEEGLLDVAASGTVRGTALNVSDLLCKRYAPASGIFAAAAAEKLAAVADWRDTEAALLLFGSSLDHAANLAKAGFDCNQFYQAWLPVTQHAVAGSPLLAARCFVVLAKLFDCIAAAPVPPTEVQVLCFQCVGDNSAPHLSRTAACHVVGRLQKRGLGTAYAPAAVSSLRTIVRQASLHGVNGLGGSVLDRYLDTLHYLLKKNPVVTADTLPSELFGVWQKCHDNPDTVDSIGDLFSILSSNPTAEAALAHQTLPALFELLQNYQALPPGVLESAVVILMRIVRKASANLLGLSVTTGVPAMAAVCFSSDDHKVGQQVALCFRALIKRVGGAGLAGSAVVLPPPMPGAGSTGPALSVVCHVVAHSFHPSKEEVSLSHSGKLVLELISNCGAQLGGDGIATLLRATLLRLYMAQTATVVQELLLPIAAMAVQRRDDLLSFLVSQPPPEIPIDGGEKLGCPLRGLPPLQGLLQVFAFRAPEFFGESDQELLLAGLASLLCPSVVEAGASVALKLPLPPDSGLCGRGKKKQEIQSVPLPLALFVTVGRVLVAVHSHRSEEEDLVGGGASESDEEEEESEDDSSEASDGSSDDADDWSAGKALVQAIAGTSATIQECAKQALAPHVAAMAPQALPHLSTQERNHLTKIFRA